MSDFPAARMQKGLLVRTCRLFNVWTVGLLVAGLGTHLQASSLEELDTLTDETIQSACHGFALHDIAQTLASWFGAESPLCKRVRAGESPRAALDSMRQDNGTRPVPRTSHQSYRPPVDTLAIECDHDVLCARERRRARSLGHPMDMATYNRVKAHCEGGYGCIEQHLADWPLLSLPPTPSEGTASIPPGFFPLAQPYRTMQYVSLFATPSVQATPLAQLPSGTTVQALARDLQGVWIQVTVNGQTGFLPSRTVLVAGATSTAFGTGAVASGNTQATLDLDELVRSGRVSQQHQTNDAQRQAQFREREQERLRQEQIERDRQQTERLNRQREQERQALARQQRQQKNQQEDRSGIALLGGLATAALGVSRGLDGTTAGNMGIAIARDIQSGNATHAPPVLASRPGPSGVGTTAKAAAAGVGGDGYMTDSVTHKCPSGSTGSIPLKFKTQVCRSAMVEFSRAYACNDFNQFQRVQQQCQQACGHPQCLQ